MLTKMLLESFK